MATNELDALVPENRRHMTGLASAMVEADKEDHRRGHHDAPREDCPLCETENYPSETGQ